MIQIPQFATPPRLRLPVADPAPPPPALQLIRPEDAARPGVEAFIQTQYARHFGARVTTFAPVLVGLRDETGELLAAAGYRGAGDGPLFLERYLPAPVEVLLAAQTGRAMERGSLVEIGHLCAARPGAGRNLMLLLGPHLARRRFQWVASTLTRELRHLLMRLGVAPLTLGPALPAALGADASGWGSYYAHDPQVLAGEIRPLRPAGAARLEADR